jgi:glutaredoxin
MAAQNPKCTIINLDEHGDSESLIRQYSLMSTPTLIIEQLNVIVEKLTVTSKIMEVLKTQV